VVPIHPMGENINLMSNSKFHKKGGSSAFLLQIDEQFAQKKPFLHRKWGFSSNVSL
jgi:hypothetical protein